MNSDEFYKDTLANGLRLITIEMPHLHVVEAACYLRVGGRDEPAELAGISHFLEHVLFRGTADFPTSLQLETAFEAIGGAVNASTDAETTCFHSRFHPDNIREGVGLFASMLRRPLFKGVEIERRVILEEAREDFNERGEDINPDNLTGALLWPGHPLSSPTIGTRDSIARISLADLRRYHQTYYVPAGTVIAIAGNASRQEALQAVEAEFGGWKGDAPPLPLPFTAQAGEGTPQSVWVRHADSQINLQLVFRLPGRRDGRNIPLRVLRRVLSGGGTARLMLNLREALGLTYSVEANLSLFEDSGCLAIDLAVAPDNLVAAVRESLAIVKELCTRPVEAEELQRVIRNFLYDLDFSLDHTEEMAGRYGWGETVACLRTLEQDRREVEIVTADAILAVARDLLTGTNLKAAIVGPYRQSDRQNVEKLLMKFRGER
jgi:predicted Zn-dependent peptidase